MRDRTAPYDPYAPLAPPDEIVADLREHGIQPTPLNVIRAAIERGHDDESAAAIASQFGNGGILAPLLTPTTWRPGAANTAVGPGRAAGNG